MNGSLTSGSGPQGLFYFISAKTFKEIQHETSSKTFHCEPDHTGRVACFSPDGIMGCNRTFTGHGI
jgi:hypothetical protein